MLVFANANIAEAKHIKVFRHSTCSEQVGSYSTGVADRSIGGGDNMCYFVSNSDVGRRILKTCPIGTDCHVVGTVENDQDTGDWSPIITDIIQSYAQPLRSTSIPSRLADDEKRLLPEVMTEFYGSFDKEKACWISTKSGPRPAPARPAPGQLMWGIDKEDTVNEDITYCMKPIRLDVIKSNGREMLFVVAGGNLLDEDGQPEGCGLCPGVLGLIVLTPNKSL